MQPRSARKHTILIVDDEPRILDSVRMNLELEGYQVFEATNGQEALDAVRLRLPDLVVMDVMMPQMDGFEALRELRKFSTVPVVLLTVKADERDVIHGLELGADDYIAKPFSQRLLLARIRAILRRSGPVREAGPEEDQTAARDGPVIERGRLSMDPARHRVTWAGRPVSLTVTEFLILEALAQRPGVIKSRNQLMDAAYPDDVFVDDRTVDSHIKRLRRKFRTVDGEFGGIETLYGAGYSFSDG